MTMQPVSSSNLAAVGYDPETQTLAIEFKSGGTYEYYDVPQQVFDGLLSAASHGQYFQSNIRGSYRYARL
jgi:hypothetical protein